MDHRVIQSGPMRGSPPSVPGSLERALDLFELLADHGELGASEIERLLDTSKPTTFRILVLGDSVTFGHGSVAEHTYPALLERPMLQEILAKHKIPYPAFKYAENTGQMAPIREQASMATAAAGIIGR